MFKKLKDKLADEVKQNPRLQVQLSLVFHLLSLLLKGTLDSVNQLAASTYSAFNKDGVGSRESLTSSQPSLNTLTVGEEEKILENGTSYSDLLSLGSQATATSSSGQFFSLGEDDEPISLSNTSSPTKTPTPFNNSGTDYDYESGTTCVWSTTRDKYFTF